MKKLVNLVLEVGFLATSIEQKSKNVELALDFTSDVALTLEGSIVNVKGPLGACSKDLSKIPIQVEKDGNRVLIRSYGSRKQDLAVANTVRSIIRNMVEGVRVGFKYRLKIVFAHFPITVKVKGDEVHIENFYGERAPRIAKIVGDTKVSVEGEDVVVKGVSLEDAGQTAANIERATTIKRKDQRVFLDGIYIYEKGKGW